MLTFIPNKTIQTIVKLSGEAIRGFLAQADAGQFRGEAHTAITSFHANPQDFSDEKLLDYGTDIIRAIDYPVRIELRGTTKEGAAQMVAKGIWGSKREKAAAEIAAMCSQMGLALHLKLAGTSSIEFNVEGVDKALPILYLQDAFEEVLKQMEYKPGPSIDCFKSKTVIAADGDGTVYDGPRVGSLPTLAESPVKEPLCAYLKAGGIFMLVSGNDINRAFKRLVDALPQEVYCRVLVAANGGAELVHVSPQGHAVAVSGYKKKALDLAGRKSERQPLDIVYIGDDGSKEGNDYPAFKAVGFEHSVLVAPAFLPEYDAGLRPGYVGGLLQGTAKFIKSFLDSHLIS